MVCGRIASMKIRQATKELSGCTTPPTHPHTHTHKTHTQHTHTSSEHLQAHADAGGIPHIHIFHVCRRRYTMLEFIAAGLGVAAAREERGIVESGLFLVSFL